MHSRRTRTESNSSKFAPGRCFFSGGEHFFPIVNARWLDDVQNTASRRRAEQRIGLWLYDREGVGPARPDAGERDPEGSVDGNEMWALALPTEDGELLALGKVLDDETRPRSQGSAECAEEPNEEGETDRRVAEVVEIVSGGSALPAS